MFGMMLFFAPVSTRAAEQNWELCLDKADFSYDVDATILAGSTTSMVKSGCKITIAVSGGSGQKWIVDVCDPSIHLDFYPTLEASPKHLWAGSAGCPTPLFGADFDDNAKEINEYKEARTKIFDLFKKVKDFYGEGWEKVDINKPGSFTPDQSAGKIACGQFLLREYLNNCMSFEEKKAEIPKTNAISNVPGIHNQTITAPKKEKEQGTGSGR